MKMIKTLPWILALLLTFGISGTAVGGGGAGDPGLCVEQDQEPNLDTCPKDAISFIAGKFTAYEDDDSSSIHLKMFRDDQTEYYGYHDNVWPGGIITATAEQLIDVHYQAPCALGIAVDFGFSRSQYYPVIYKLVILDDNGEDMIWGVMKIAVVDLLVPGCGLNF